MAPAVLHLVPAAGGFLRAEHVRGRGGGELPQVPGDAGAGGEGAPRDQARQETGKETKEYG